MPSKIRKVRVGSGMTAFYDYNVEADWLFDSDALQEIDESDLLALHLLGKDSNKADGERLDDLLARFERDATAVLAAYDGGGEIDSPQGYAHSILSLIRFARLYRGEGRHDMACLTCMEIGWLVREMDLKHRQEPIWDTGEKLRSGLSKGREITSRARREAASPRHSRWIKEAKAIWSKNPKLSRKRCAELVIAKLDGSEPEPPSVRTVKEVISKHKPDKVGAGD